jgi:glycosyltransferase involved in cell wall biosynthesis
MWADLCRELVIAAPVRAEPPGEFSAAVDRPNVILAPQREIGGRGWYARFQQLLALPATVARLGRAMRDADAVHVRCPGSLGLLGALMAPLCARRMVAKYAGQWTGFPGEPWTWRLQRAVLRSRWWPGPVTVYGQWPDQPGHVVPFFTSILTEDQIARARRAARDKHLGRPLQVLFVGRLTASKNVDVLLHAVSSVARSGIPVQCTILGEGVQRGPLETLVARLGLDACVQFVGAVDFEAVLAHYERAHVLVLASDGEGWPKAIAEAMAFGLVCIGSARGLIPQMLGDGRGLVVAPRDADALGRALCRIAESPERYRAMSRAAAVWGQRHSLEDLREAIARLLSQAWGMPIEPRTPCRASPAAEVRT